MESMIQRELEKFENTDLGENIDATDMDLAHVFNERLTEEKRETIHEAIDLAYEYGPLNEETYNDCREILENWGDSTDRERIAFVFVYDALNELAANMDAPTPEP